MDKKFKNGRPHFQLTDGMTHRILEFLSTDDPDAIRQVLNTYQSREYVEYIVTDFTRKYDGLIEFLYPNARHLRDSRHLLGLLHEARESVRLDAYQRATGDARSALRGHRDFWERVGQADWSGQQGSLFEDAPLVTDANRAYLQFVNWWRSATNRIEAAQHYEYWAENIPASIRPYFVGKY